ncbi:MAG TPA: TRAP transporter small permease [Casimicrobiaceae bacterium]
MSAWLKLAERMLDALAVALFALMFGVVILQVALRYVFNHPLVWTDEAAAYFLVWISFLGWTMASRKRIHIGIAFVVERLPGGARRALHAFWAAAAVVFAIVLFVVGIAITRANGDVRMVSIDFAFWPVYLAAPSAAVFLFVYALRDLLQIVRKGDIKATEAQL